MAFKVTKEEAERLEALADKLGNAREFLEDELDDLNRQIRESLDTINFKIAGYNELLEEARGIIDDVHSQGESDFDDKSEKWQEGERGEATREWLESLESIRDDDLGDIEPIEFEDIALGEQVEDHQVILTENLNHEPSY